MSFIKLLERRYLKMKLYIKQAVLTLGEKFSVKNELGEDVYYVEGSFLKIPKNFSVYDISGKKLACIYRKHITFMPTFVIETEDKTITLKQQLAFARMKFTIEETAWSLRGNFTAHEYEVISGHHPIMSISKHWFTWGDSYELDIENKVDALLSLCIVIAVDYALLLASSN